MICSRCVHCGLCLEEGAAKFLEKKVNFTLETEELLQFKDSEKGIAFDIGTTTVEADIFDLNSKKKIASVKQLNQQSEFGMDVVSRISFSLKENGLKILHKIIENQLKEIIVQAEKSFGLIKRVVISANTCMLSLLQNVSVSSLSAFPFSVPEGLVYKTTEDSRDVFFVPPATPFVGGDIVSSFVDLDFFSLKNNAFLCDIGTNCEIAVYDALKKSILCTSAAAGPCFEGFGIECGLPAVEGAVYQHGKIIGDKEPKGFCATGVISEISHFLEEGSLLKDGAFENGEDKKYVYPHLYISQKDVRNIQLAKSALKTGLELLSAHSGVKNGVLYLSGAFGSKLNETEAERLSLFPSSFFSEIKKCGNTSLNGASKILINPQLEKKCFEYIEKCVSLDLAMDEKFNEMFIKNLAF